MSDDAIANFRERMQRAKERGETIPGPGTGVFCYRHWSWLCQALQGECQRERNFGEPLDV